MSSILIPYKVCPLVNSCTIVMNYPDSYTVHVERDGTVFVWPEGYGGECREYDSVHHHNGWPDKPRRVNSNTHAGYDWSGGGGGGQKMELEEGEIVEEEGEGGEEGRGVEEVEACVIEQLKFEIAQMRCLLQGMKAYLNGFAGEIAPDEKAAVEEEVFSLGITLARKENFYLAVSQGLLSAFPCAEDNPPENLKAAAWEALDVRGKKLRDKTRTKAFRRDRETARLNKSGFRFQQDEDEAEAYVAKKLAEAETEAEAEADLLEDADYAERFEKRIRSLLV